MPADVSLSSIEFKSMMNWPVVLSSVQVNYSNGQSSTVFENDEFVDEYGDAHARH